MMEEKEGPNKAENGKDEQILRRRIPNEPFLWVQNEVNISEVVH